MFFDRLQFICSQDRVKDVSGLLRELNLSTSKGTAWRGGSIPKGDVLTKIADYFHVSIDYLLCRTDDPAPSGQKEKLPALGGELTPERQEAWNLISQMNDKDFKKFMKMAKTMLEE